jgi:hypothetical protein
VLDLDGTSYIAWGKYVDPFRRLDLVFELGWGLGVNLGFRATKGRASKD